MTLMLLCQFALQKRSIGPWESLTMESAYSCTPRLAEDGNGRYSSPTGELVSARAIRQAAHGANGPLSPLRDISYPRYRLPGLALGQPRQLIQTQRSFWKGCLTPSQMAYLPSARRMYRSHRISILATRKTETGSRHSRLLAIQTARISSGTGTTNGP